MEARPGDRVRVHVDGDRRPPLTGVVIDVRGFEGLSAGSVIVIEQDGDRRRVYVAGCVDIEVMSGSGSGPTA